LVFVSFILQSISVQAQNTEGTEFWLTFAVNETAWTPYYLQIRIVGGSQKTTGTIYFTNLDATEHFIIEPNEVYDYTLNSAEMAAVYNIVMGKTNRSVRINTSKPVSVYAFNYRESTTYDVTNVFPVEVLGKDYYQISYYPSHPSYYEAYAVVATQNNTQIFHEGIPVPVGILNKGEVYYRTSTTDMTGTHITSNQPVALFAVSQCCPVPAGFSGLSHLFQQLAPINTWDKKFFVPVTLEKNILRIVASKDGTNITQTGGTIRTGVPGAQTSLTGLQAGDFVELDINIANSGCFIESNYPVGICSYLTNYGYSVPRSNPSQCWIPGIEQKITSIKLAPFIPESTIIPYQKTHYALIITSKESKDDTKVSIGGGIPTDLFDGTWIDKDAVGMSFYSMPLTNFTETYLFTNPKGFIIVGYGIKTTGAGTYYYLAGSAMRDLDAYYTAEEIHFQDLKDNPMCEGDVHFLAKIEGLHPTHPERLTWWINGTEYLPAKNLEQWSKTFSVGEYEIEMKVRYVNDETTTKTGTLIIKSCNQSAAFFANNVLHSELKDTTFCNKNVNFRAEIEGLHPAAPDSIMWYIDNVFETSQATWNKTFENGTYEIKLVVHYDNDTYATLTGTLKVQALWIKIRNVRY